MLTIKCLNKNVSVGQLYLKYKYSDLKSMISNDSIQVSTSIKHLIDCYQTIQPYMTPRIVSIASRRFAYFCSFDNPNHLSQDYLEAIKQFYKKVLLTDIRLLYPDQCYNLIYFLRITKQFAQHFNISQNEIDKYRHRLLNQTLKYINLLPFNRSCDILLQISKLKVSNEPPTQHQELLLKQCLQQFPRGMLQRQQIDSIYHVIELYQLLLKMPLKNRPAELFKQTCHKLMRLSEYLHFTIAHKLINLNVANYHSYAPSSAQFDAFVCLLRQIYKLIQQESHKSAEDVQPEYEKVKNKLNDFIQKIVNKNECTQQTLLTIALQLNKLPKFQKTKNQLRRQKQQLQKEMLQLQNIQIFGEEILPQNAKTQQKQQKVVNSRINEPTKTKRSKDQIAKINMLQDIE